MLNSTLLLLAILGYLAATVILARAVRYEVGEAKSKPAAQHWVKLSSWLAAAAAIAHLVYALQHSIPAGTLNFSLSSMVVLISVILMLIYLMGTLAMPIHRLGIMIFPLTVVSLVFAYLWNSETSFTDQYGTMFSIHILISIVAYSMLALASIQALLYVYQERQIKNRTTSGMLMALPPLQTMEQLLFRLLGVGFLLLSLALLSGAVFSQQIYGQPFEFKHHTVLALLGWCVFATLLYKRFKSGLRGSQAVLWTITGFVLIQLGYFGTKIVTESLNIQ